uniref:Uncharacterized protein n=1 Tax=Nelumbo nucifera TaxID=4432 RepID=A0A822YY45_NELNU|nr:TPA_asm: hypothetical protein HUJ06_008081 [Nelumbo nucifera]
MTRRGRHFKPPQLESQHLAKQGAGDASTSMMPPTVPPMVQLAEPSVPSTTLQPEPSIPTQVIANKSTGRTKVRVETSRQDGDVVKQLKRTPASISVWGLLMTSLGHRKAVMDLLIQAHDPIDISPQDLAHTIASLDQTRAITFTNQDLPKEGVNFTKALNITVDCMNQRVPLCLIDNGAGLNVCPLWTAQYLGLEDDLHPPRVIVKAFDSHETEVEGEVTINPTIGPVRFQVTFVVFNALVNFNLLLERPWLHSIGPVPLSLHQRVKFFHGGDIVSILGDPELHSGIHATTERVASVRRIQFKNPEDENITLLLGSTNIMIV